MRHPVIATIGYALCGAVFVGLWLVEIIALRDGLWFTGENYKGMPIGTYSTLLVLVMVTALGAFVAIRWVVRRLRRR